MSADFVQSYRRAVAELTAPGAPFEIVTIQAAGRSMPVLRNAPSNFCELIDAAAENFSECDFLIENDQAHSFGEVIEDSRRLASALVRRFDVRPGDRVGIAMRNRREYFIALFAAARAGAICVLFNSRGAADELAASAADLACTVLAADSRRATQLRHGGVEAPIVLVRDDQDPPLSVENVIEFQPLVAAHTPLREAVAVAPDDPLCVLFTSGTSGRPKGAVLSHRNIISMASTGAIVGAARARLSTAPSTGGTASPQRSLPTSLMVFPLFHVSGLNVTANAIGSGGRFVMMPRWDPKRALELIGRYGVNSLAGPPMMYTDLLDLPGADERLSGIQTVTTGGQATPVNIRERLARLLPQATFGTGWGMTEACGSVVTGSGELLKAKPESSGIISPLMDVRAMSDDGREVAPGEVGELQVRGALTMLGYWNQLRETKEAFQDDWYRTGDLGWIDEDRFVFIVDRKKDMVISAGENVYCAEVERVLSMLPEIAEVAVFGAPDARLGERAIAAVGLRPGTRLSADDIKAFARTQLAAYKTPAEVIFDLSPFPRNVAGKVDKRRLATKFRARTPPA
jgi:acyl-CoA synthetase (AMP-forming)/AMP-acid ligase II